jgi:hypothetical protein
VDAGDHTARSGDQTATERRGERRRYTVAEAAEILGITAEAVRTRIKRGKLGAVKEPDAPGGTVYVLLETDPTRPNSDPTMKGQDQTSDQTHRSELVHTLREQVAYLQGVIATRDRELATRAEEIRRRDAALEREQKLTAVFAEQLRELQAPDNGADKKQVREERPTSTEVFGASFATTMLFAAGVGLAAGVANPLLISESIARTGHLLWLALFLLWALPPIFGLWLGRTVAESTASLSARIDELQEQINSSKDSRDLEMELSDATSRKSALPARPVFSATLVGLIAVLSSLPAPYAFGILINLDALSIVRVLAVATAQGIVAAMFVLFAAQIGIGRARQRREEARQISGGGTVREAKAANRQALIGLVGTIITAVLALVGVLVEVFAGTGGTGG